MTSRLTGANVVVTGGSSGIGLAVARAVAAEGARPILIGRRAEALAEAAADLPAGTITLRADVGDATSIGEAFDELASQVDRVDALLNVAGTVSFRRLEDMSADAIEHVVRTNYLGPVFTLRAALPLLRAADHADVLNVSSEATKVEVPWASIYVSSKAALEAFTRTIADELRPDRIRVSCLVVGSTNTNIASTIPREELVAAHPVLQESRFYERVGQPMDPAWVADTIVFAITRPPGQVMDVFHARSFAPWE